MPASTEEPAAQRPVAAFVAVGLALWLGADVVLAVPGTSSDEVGSFHFYPWALAATWVLHYGGAAMVVIGLRRIARRFVARRAGFPF